MRTLVRWSLSSFRTTTPTPRNAEPSRRAMNISLLRAFEIARVDCFETGFRHRQVQQATARAYYGGGGLGTNVAFGGEEKARWTHGLDVLHPGHGSQTVGEPLAFRFHLNPKASA